jgi:hypothetical protein
MTCASDSEDYEQKYPRDKIYHQLDPDALVWRVYNDEAEIFDKEFVESAGDSLDILLVFVSSLDQL